MKITWCPSCFFTIHVKARRVVASEMISSTQSYKPISSVCDREKSPLERNTYRTRPFLRTFAPCMMSGRQAAGEKTTMTTCAIIKPSKHQFDQLDYDTLRHSQANWSTGAVYIIGNFDWRADRSKSMIEDQDGGWSFPQR